MACSHLAVLRRLVDAPALLVDSEGLVTGACEGCGLLVTLRPGRRGMVAYLVHVSGGGVEVRRVSWAGLMGDAA